MPLTANTLTSVEALSAALSICLPVALVCLTSAHYLLTNRVTTSTLSSITISLLILALWILVQYFGTYAYFGERLLVELGDWVNSGLFVASWNFKFDSLTYTMLIVVLSVSTLVHLYSLEYMSEDPHRSRFVSYLSLFTFFMLLLITADNFISLFLGWEGVGLCSYLLISFWQTRIQANKAAIKAMIVNRVADLAFTIGILVVFYGFQTVEFSPVFGLAPYLAAAKIVFGNVELYAVTVLTLLLFLGAMGKSAQIGLHTWLPDAMEGPTPVSALIHAATMVTSGIFLIVRCSPLFEMAPTTLLVILLVGASTAFMAATAGLVQNDLKKIIAYSTCSQLGYMAFTCGLSHYALSLFHLTNHAFFKALLFLSAGAVIHAMSDEQDLRRLGGLLRFLPYTYIMFLVGSLALMGFPFLTGFYSKDLILETAAGSDRLLTLGLYVLPTVTALFTAFYSFRLLDLAFYSRTRSPRTYIVQGHELTPKMAIALALLALGSIFFGYLARDLFVGFGSPFWNGVIYQAPISTGAQLNGEFIPLGVKLVPLFGAALSVIAVCFANRSHARTLSRALESSARLTWTRFLAHKWYFDTVYNLLLNQPLLIQAYRHPFKLIDKGLLEVVGPTGGMLAISRLGQLTAAAQTGVVYHYATVMLVFLVVASLVLCNFNLV